MLICVGNGDPSSTLSTAFPPTGDRLPSTGKRSFVCAEKFENDRTTKKQGLGQKKQQNAQISSKQMLNLGYGGWFSIR
jgi:hypothetical protein